MRRLILTNRQCPGDVTVMSATLRDLHLANPGQFETDVRTSADSLWENNPYVTRLTEGTPEVETIDMQYPLIHQSNQRPFHFIHAYPQFLEQRLGVRVPVSKFHGDIHLSAAEKASSPLDGHSLPSHYWIMIAGGKNDFTAKWWNPASYQKVVDHFQGVIPFIQCGEAGHWHPPLSGVVNLVGKTTTRQFVRLMHYAAGVVCPVTFAMHLAAAVETRSGRPKHRPCVVIAGGREPTQWEAYPHHQYISTTGMLSCCQEGGCWKSRCQLVGDGDNKDRQNVCEQPVQITPELRIPRCQDMISAEDVIRRIEMYLSGGMAVKLHGADDKSTLDHKSSNGHVPLGNPPTPHAPATKIAPLPANGKSTSGVLPRQSVLIEFRHGLGDAVQFTGVLRHLRQAHPEWDIDIASLRGKHSAFTGLCRHSVVSSEDVARRSHYQQFFSLEWHECHDNGDRWPSTKLTRCLQEVFRLTPNPALCRYEIQVGEAARQSARTYLESLCGPANDSGRYRSVVIHYEGNTSCEQKNLTHSLIREVCGIILDQGHVPIILDWDRRSPLPDGVKIHCPDTSNPLWKDSGTGDASMIAALIEASTLMIGIDSGPLHVAGATSTPTIGVWTRHHPVHYFDLADNVLHLVPRTHAGLAAGPAAASYFESHYHHRTYETLGIGLLAEVTSRLNGINPAVNSDPTPAKPLRATGYTADYYEEHKRAGLDYLGFGEWQQQYGRWLVQSLGWSGQRVLDIGCACGSILRGFGQAGAIVQGVDVCESMIQLGRNKWPDMAPLLFVCDAVNLHLFQDGSWQGLHSAQSAEHWKPELVPFILRELARVTVPGSLFFCALDTEELFARQGRTLEQEDPTHICIKPMSWWHEQLTAAGWDVCSTEYESILNQHPENFLSRYDWDWFVARRLL